MNFSNSKLCFSQFLAVTFFSLLAHAAAPPSASLDTFSVGYRGEYFFSTQNLGTVSGDTDTLPFDGDYSNFANNFEVAYTFANSLRLHLGGTWSYADSTTSYVGRDNSQFNRTTFGAQFYQNFGRFLVIPMFMVHIAAEDFDPTQNEVFTSETSNQYQAGAWMKYPIWKFDTWGYLGYRATDDDKAHHLVWSVGTRFYPSNWFISGEIIGYNIFRHDINDFNPSNRTFTNNNVAGGSLKYNAVDPEYMDAEILAGFRTKSGYELSAGVNHTMTGKNTAYGPTILVAFTMDFRWDEKPLDSANRVSDTKNFKPDFENYDESTFSDD